MDRRNFLKSGCSALGLALSSPKAFSGEKPLSVDHTKDSLTRIDKIKRFDEDLAGDTWVELHDVKNFYSLAKKLNRLRSFVGYGNFNLVSFDDFLKLSTKSSKLEPITAGELRLFEKLFFANAKEYGFYGEKVITNQTYAFKRSQCSKIPRTGHFLLKGRAEELYSDLRKKIGDDLVLTSGVRGVVKQMSLFMNKAIATNGNLSRASRSLAPPGHSFHGAGDFDVGKVGLGYANFTEKFADTDIYKRLTDLGYVNIRYTDDNKFGVRYEPWHIKVV